MDYPTALKFCKDDLLTKDHTELLRAGRKYGIPFVSRDQLCEALAMKFMTRRFKAQLQSYSPDFILEYIKTNENVFTEVLEMLREADSEIFAGDEIPEERDPETLERHVLISMSGNIIPNNEVLQWILEHEPDIDFYDNYPMVVKIGDNLFVSTGIIPIIKVTVENVDWLSDYFDEEDLAELVVSTGIPDVARKVLRKYPNLGIDLGKALRFATSIKDPDVAEEKVAIVVDMYGQPNKELREQITAFYNTGREFIKPTTRELLKLLEYDITITRGELFAVAEERDRLREQAYEAQDAGDDETAQDLFEAADELISKKGVMDLIKEYNIPLTREPLQHVNEERCSPPPEFKMCGNNKDYTTEDCWSEKNSPDVIIAFLDANNLNARPLVECYKIATLTRMVTSPDYQFRGWYPNFKSQALNEKMDESGMGGSPSIVEQLVKFDAGYPLFVLNCPEELQRLHGKYVGYPLYKNKRVGNPRGIHGISQHHGQTPGYTVFYLVKESDTQKQERAVISKVNELLETRNVDERAETFGRAMELIREYQDVIPVADRVSKEDADEIRQQVAERRRDVYMPTLSPDDTEDNTVEEPTERRGVYMPTLSPEDTEPEIQPEPRADPLISETGLRIEAALADRFGVTTSTIRALYEQTHGDMEVLLGILQELRVQGQQYNVPMEAVGAIYERSEGDMERTVATLQALAELDPQDTREPHEYPDTPSPPSSSMDLEPRELFPAIADVGEQDPGETRELVSYAELYDDSPDSQRATFPRAPLIQRGRFNRRKFNTVLEFLETKPSCTVSFTKPAGTGEWQYNTIYCSSNDAAYELEDFHRQGFDVLLSNDFGGNDFIPTKVTGKMLTLLERHAPEHLEEWLAEINYVRDEFEKAIEWFRDQENQTLVILDDGEYKFYDDPEEFVAGVSTLRDTGRQVIVSHESNADGTGFVIPDANSANFLNFIDLVVKTDALYDLVDQYREDNIPSPTPY